MVFRCFDRGGNITLDNLLSFCIGQAILSANCGGKIRKRGKSRMLDTFVSKLLAIGERRTDAGTGVAESKIHATNVLRALFRNRDLDEQMSYYVERALIASLLGVRSSCWNVMEEYSGVILRSPEGYNIIIFG